MDSHKLHLRIRPYCAESTASRPISEVKLRQASLVLGWETTRESRVPYPFFCFWRSFIFAIFCCVGMLQVLLFLLHSRQEPCLRYHACVSKLWPLSFFSATQQGRKETACFIGSSTMYSQIKNLAISEFRGNSLQIQQQQYDYLALLLSYSS